MGELPQKEQEYFTEEEYLLMEAQSEYRHEYFQGKVLDMAGGTDVHNEISGNAFVFLKSSFSDRGCRTYMADVKLAINAFYAYPDVFVTCEEADLQNRVVKRHPLIVVEVLSKDTAHYDRSIKLQQYRKASSLMAYLLVDQYLCRVECYSRFEPGSDGWLYRTFERMDEVIELPDLGLRIPVRTLYEGVMFESLEDADAYE